MEASALLKSLAINRPFVEDNKRVAFAAADMFLRINGWRLKGAPTQIYAEMIAMFRKTGFHDKSTKSRRQQEKQILAKAIKQPPESW